MDTSNVIEQPAKGKTGGKKARGKKAGKGREKKEKTPKEITLTNSELSKRQHNSVVLPITVSFKEPSGDEQTLDLGNVKATFFLAKEDGSEGDIEIHSGISDRNEDADYDFFGALAHHSGGGENIRAKASRPDGRASRRTEHRLSLPEKNVGLPCIIHRGSKIMYTNIYPEDVSVRGLGFFTGMKMKKGDKLIICVGYRYVHGKVAYATQLTGRDIWRVGFFGDDLLIDLKSLFLLHGYLD